MSHQAAPRPFSTSARVYPSYLPYLHTVHTTAARNKNMKWVTPAVAMAGVAGYAMASYRGTQTDRRLSDVSAADEAETQRRRQNMMLADAYGDRSSLAELEHALRVYETQQVPE